MRFRCYDTCLFGKALTLTITLCCFVVCMPSFYYIPHFLHIFIDTILELEQKSRNCVNVQSVSLTGKAPHSTIDEEESLPWIFAITPTHKRLTQLLDLTSLCQTLMLIRNFVWIVVEDGYLTSDAVKDLLNRCKVKVIHLCARNVTEWSTPSGRGVEQRNVGLQWIRKNCYTFQNCSGSFFFMDDDNKYDLRIFDQVELSSYVCIESIQI